MTLHLRIPTGRFPLLEELHLPECFWGVTLHKREDTPQCIDDEDRHHGSIQDPFPPEGARSDNA